MEDRSDASPEGDSKGLPSGRAIPTPGDVRATYHSELGPGERSVLMAWLGFGTTFGVVRGVTYSVRTGRGPFHDMDLGGTHLHHYLWGILMLSGVGAIGLRGEDRTRRHPLLAWTYGTALALIVDEFALLLDLKDVYWAKQGRISVDLGVGAIAFGGTTFAALPLLRRLLRHVRSVAGRGDV